MNMPNMLKKVSRAFSLIELIVVIAIFSIISMLVLANHSRFNSSVLLGSLAYDIALSIREAQVYGLSVKQFSNQFQVGYGVTFSKNDPTHYIFFVDTNANKKYDAATDAELQRYSVGLGHTITKFCGVSTSGVSQCSDGSTAVTIDHLDVVFFRPEPDANISSSEPGNYSEGTVVVASPNKNAKTILIMSTGQISVLNSQCSDGVDNDSDGTIDYSADTGCTSQSDDTE
jgi:prepilin-type N-terminal cleavage/methylation domain-containing protein